MTETVEESVSEVEVAAEIVEEPAEERLAEARMETTVETAVDVDEEAASDASESEPQAEPEPEPELPPLEPTVFRGPQKNPSVAIAVFLAGIMTFAMGITDTFFAEASAWTFVIWGLLLLFSNLLDNYQAYELNNEGIGITNPIRFWYPNKKWVWDDVYRLDILVGRRDTKLEHADMHIYHELSGEVIKDREDRKLDPSMAQIIIDRAGLQPVDDSNPPTVAQLTLNQKNKYHWSKSGAIG